MSEKMKEEMKESSFVKKKKKKKKKKKRLGEKGKISVVFIPQRMLCIFLCYLRTFGSVSLSPEKSVDGLSVIK